MLFWTKMKCQFYNACLTLGCQASVGGKWVWYEYYEGCEALKKDAVCQLNYHD